MTNEAGRRLAVRHNYGGAWWQCFNSMGGVETRNLHNLKLSNLFKMKNETKEPIIEVGMVFKDRANCKYQIIKVDVNLNSIKTIDVHPGGDLEPYEWTYYGFLRSINEGRLIQIEPDKLAVALAEIESLKEKLEAYKEALESSDSVIQSFQKVMGNKEPSTPYYPSRLDFLTAAALTGLVSRGTVSFSKIGFEALDIAKDTISELDKEVK